jgi:hypothetical protein
MSFASEVLINVNKMTGLIKVVRTKRESIITESIPTKFYSRYLFGRLPSWKNILPLLDFYNTDTAQHRTLAIHNIRCSVSMTA